MYYFQEYNAKLSDFGLAKLGPEDGNSHVTTKVVGTYGYAAPEYMATGTYLLFFFNFTGVINTIKLIFFTKTMSFTKKSFRSSVFITWTYSKIMIM